MIDVKVAVFLMLNATIPLTSTLGNEYPSSNETSKRMVQCEGIVSLAMPCFCPTLLPCDFKTCSGVYLISPKHPVCPNI